MSEEFSTDYKDGDIVWVKLGPSWWPGEVRDLNKIPPDEIEFKKPPLVVVKFFEEDAYEYVRTWTNIYPYNCDKKADFIKKGMAAFRSKAPHMEKFPRDVTTAEMKMGGNPNILSDPACLPEKKRNIVAEIFGSPNAKKSPRDPNKKPRASLKHNPKDTAHLTHRRFLGVDDYKAYICIQYPGKDRIPGDSEDEEVIRINTEPEQEYNCYSCSYTTRRLEVMILHTKSHRQGGYVSSPGRKRPAAARPRKKEYVKKKAKTYSDDSSSEDVPEPPKEKKRKTKVSTAPKKLPKKVVEEVKPKSVDDIRTDLLAEWEDSDDEFDNSMFSKTSKLSSDSFDITGVIKMNDTDDLSRTEPNETENGDNETIETENGDNETEETENGDNEMKETENGNNDNEMKETENGNNDDKSVSDIESETLVSPKGTPKLQMDKDTQDAIKSCFDFDEDDEDDDFINTTVEVGRKIPRVIPPTEKRKSEILEDIIDLEEGINNDEISEKIAAKETEELENTFKDLMDTTSVPRLPDIENSLKPTQNFHAVTTVKFPDKPDESSKKDREKRSTDVPINPKKRFVKSFEDFENQLQREEKRRREDERLKSALKEPEVNDDQNQVFQEAKSSFSGRRSSIDRENETGDAPNEPTSPRRDPILERIVRNSTNDFSGSSGEEEVGIDFNRLQKTIMSKIIEEAKISDESRNRILSKMKPKTPTRSVSETDEVSVPERRYSARCRAERSASAKDERERSDEDVLPSCSVNDEEIVRPPSPSTEPEKVALKSNRCSTRASVEEESISSGNDSNEIEKNDRAGDEKEERSSLEPAEEKTASSLIEELKSTILNDWDEEDEPIASSPPPIRRSLRSASREKPNDVNEKEERAVKQRDVAAEKASKSKKSRRLRMNDADSFEIDPPRSVSLPVKIDKKLVFDAARKDDPKSVGGFLEKYDEETEVYGKKDSSEIKLISNDFTSTDVTAKEPTTSDFAEKTVAANEPVDTEETDATKEIDATEEIGATEEIDATEIDVTEKINVTEEIDATDKINITNEIDATEEVEAIKKGVPLEEIDAAKEIPFKDLPGTEELVAAEEIDAVKEMVTTEDIEAAKEIMATTEVATKSITSFSEEEVATKEITRAEDEETAAGNVSVEEKSEADSNAVFEPIDNDGAVNEHDKDNETISERLSNGITMSANESVTASEEARDVAHDLSCNMTEETLLDRSMVASLRHEEFPPVAAALPEDAICEPVSKPNKRKKGRRRSSRFTARKKRKVNKETIEPKLHFEPTEAETETGSLPDESAEDSTVPNCSEDDSKVTEEEEEEEKLIEPDGESTIDNKITEIDTVEEETIFEVTIEQDSSKSHIDTDTEITESEEITEAEDSAAERNFASEIPISAQKEPEESQDELVLDEAPMATEDKEAIRHPGRLETGKEKRVSSDEEAVTNTDDIDEQGQITVDSVSVAVEDEVKVTSEHFEIEKVVQEAEHVSSDVLECTEQEEAITTPEHLEIEKVAQDPISSDVSVSTEKELVVIQQTAADDQIHGRIPICSERAIEKDVPIEYTVPEEPEVQKELLKEQESKEWEPINEQTISDDSTAIEKEEIVLERSDDEELVTDRIEAEEKTSGTAEVVTDVDETNESADDEFTRKFQAKAATTKQEELINSLFTFSQSKMAEPMEIKIKKSVSDDTMDDDDDDNNLTDLVSDIVQKLNREQSDKTRDSEMDHLSGTPISKQTSRNDNYGNDAKAKLEISCDSNSRDAFKFSIQTDLSNLSRSEEITAIALATLSETKTADSNFPEKLSETEMVAIEGNLTVMSEKDLADAQVEITTDKVISKKPVTLSNFSMDFSDSTSDSGSLTIEPSKFADFDSKGTEFTSRAITKELKPKSSAKKANAFDQCELLDILEGTNELEKKIVEFQTPTKIFSGDITDFEECIPSQIVCTKEFQKNMNDELKKKDKSGSVMSTTSKLLERLTDVKHLEPKTELPPDSPKNQKIKSKPVILSEQIIKPAAVEGKKAALANNTVDDIEDVEAFVIHKDLIKKTVEVEEEPKAPAKAIRRPRNKPAGKAKILQQTIITPAGEIIQPAVAMPKKKPVAASITRITPESLPSILSNTTSKSSTTVISNVTMESTNQDDNIFDIFNMPIVLSDQILTPESIENMPIVIDGNPAVNKPTQTIITPTTTKVPATKVATKIISGTTPTSISTKLSNLTPKQKPRILQSVGPKPVSLTTAVLPQKPGKYIIVSQGSPGIASQKTVVQKKTIMKRTALPAGIAAKVAGNSQEITGNKIMVVTNQQGQQQRLLLTPAQQKVLGYQPPTGPKLAKTVVKTNLLQKSIAAVSKPEAGCSKTSSLLGQKIVATTSQFLSTTSASKPIKTAIKSRLSQNLKSATSTSSKSAKTILITNRHGQTIKKIATTEDDIDKQVAEQLEAIKASSGMQFGTQSKPDIVNNKAVPKAPIRRPYCKKYEHKSKATPPLIHTDMSTPPPLVTASKKPPPAPADTKKIVKEEPKPQQERPLNQLVIQDALGNQTTITEGQILAIPSETVDGQPQSYMLVTLDQAGNLTPLNNEALMSLDPNLGLGGDLSNMVLQIDQGSSVDQPVPLAQPATVKLTNPGEELRAGTSKIDIPRAAAPLPLPVADEPPTAESIVSNTNGEQGQQLIVTGDPIATQKFLESLTEGTTDLANIIAHAEGKSILIQTDGQQILINTNADDRLLPNVGESTEGGGNPIFATQPSKNTDILAAALADTDVFTAQPKMLSQLSPSNGLYPMNVGNVLETSLTLSSPIMTPLEVPSTNVKKIADDILTRVPNNVDLPITVTDPNISQTVANQRAANLMAAELGLGLAETTISGVSTGYGYALAALDDGDMSHKPFNGSMPLLNDDVVEASPAGESREKDDDTTASGMTSEAFLEEESRFTLGGGMCSSLSEPPPEMFDIPDVTSYGEKNGNDIPLSLQSTPDSKEEDDATDAFSNQAESSSEGSCEIPVQPKIVAKAVDLPAGSEM